MKKLLFVINQFFKGGAETALLNLLRSLDPSKYQVDLLVYDQIKLDGVVSLLPLLPDWIHVCDAVDRENSIAFVKKAYHRLIRDLTHHQLYRRSCYDFVRGKRYDAAISYGEWFSPEFVATKVRADQKIVWIHSDIDRAQFFNSELMFRYDEQIQLYLFASQKSMEAAIRRYPQLQGRGAVVHNMCDDQAIRRAGEEPLDLPVEWKRPLLVTVANFRAEKNHLRQLEAMRLLKQRGFDFTWVNMGSDTDAMLIAKIDAQTKRYGLQGRFIRLPAQKSPYRYMHAADAVAVLSDFESWSLVITEAKLLGIPVVATKTSGALEQLQDGVTGVLCDFSPEDIADKIQHLLTDADLRERIRRHLQGFSTGHTVLREFDQALETGSPPRRQKLLYISDNINYVSGVQKVTAAQAQALRKDFDISLFSMEPANTQSRELFEGITIYGLPEPNFLTGLTLPTREVLHSSSFSARQKTIRLLYYAVCRAGLEDRFIDIFAGKQLRQLFEQFDAVYVLSEASKLRRCVSQLEKPRKVQYIHTDYVAWRNLNDWTQKVTAQDAQIYRQYDEIVCLSPKLKEKFCNLYPHLSDKVTVASNQISASEILEKAKEKCSYQVEASKLNLITIGRMEWEKRYDRLLEIANLLKKRGVLFHWYFVGDGKLMEEVQTKQAKLKLEKEVTLTGAMKNPYPLLKHCDLFVLFSDYEGTPVTIEEAKVLGVPVLANAVGGIEDQLENEKYGKVVRQSNATPAEYASAIQQMEGY